ncbi:extracellular solute-binding protein [Paenibacillus thiaminolyticus]|uniref:extracellular solute-binding protein n=1 Tax=Paenibacillus thiaminolyticus TaxID=49283 RepID=UPI003D2E5541
MKKGIKRWTSILLISCLAVAVAGCGSSKPAAETGKDTGPSDPITFMHMFDKNAEGGGLHQAELLDKFTVDNPDIKLDQEIQSHDNYETKIKTLAAANELPDVFLMKSSMVTTFVENGLVRPVDDLLDKDPDWKNGFVDGALDTYQVDGQTYGIQFSGGPTHVIYYNKDLVAKAGFSEFPKTWDDFLKLIDNLKAENITPIAFGNKGKWLANSSYMSTLGDRFTGTQWFESLANHKGAKFTDKEFVEALALFQDLAKRGSFNNDMNSIDNNQMKTLYYNGKAAMFIEGAWASNAVETGGPQEILDKTELAVFPAIDGAKGDQNGVSGGGGWAYAINANIDESKLDDIAKLMKTLSDKEAAKVILKYGDIPSSKVDNINELDLSPLTKKMVKLLETTKYVPIYDSRLSPGLTEAMNSAMQEMLIGQLTPEKAAEVMQKEYENEM